jgi:hypothetical protein
MDKPATSLKELLGPGRAMGVVFRFADPLS